MTTTHPTGYEQRSVTLDQLRTIHAPKMHPEFARRLFAWLAHHDGFGIGGGWRSTQPVKPGFAPDGKSFHQSQTFASGFVGYAAVDLVVAVPGKPHRSPTWAECADAPRWGLHTFIANEPWHMQCHEMRGWQTWVNAGRPDPPTFNLLPPAPGELQPPEVIDPNPPDDDEEEDDMALDKIVKPSGGWVQPWWPWLACFTSGAVRPAVSGETATEVAVSDEGQYRRMCHAAGVQLTNEKP